MAGDSLRIDLLSGSKEVEKMFQGDRPEIMLLTADNEEQQSMLFIETRKFLRERGLQIGDSEPINLQILCRDPNHSKQRLNMIVIRKACKFEAPVKILSVFVI